MNDLPEKHPSLGRLPLDETGEVVLHSAFEDVALLTVEVSDEVSVRPKVVIAP